MEVILLERIERLGQMGDVVKVKSGFARNFLLPQKKALRATEENKRQFEEKRAQLEATNLEHRQEAEKVGAKLDGLSVVMIRQAGEAGQLYGSVNARDIATGLTEAGFTVTRQQVVLPHPIKTIGIHPVHVSLHPEVAVEVNANVARSDDEAKIQAKTGKAVVSAEDEQATPAEKAAPEAEAAAEAPAEGAEEKADEVVLEQADEAVIEQAEEIFEEGAVPNIEPESDDAGADAGDGGKDAESESKK